MNSEKDNLPGRFDVDLSPFTDFMKQMDTFFNESFKHMNSFFEMKPFWVDVNETESDIVVEAALNGYKRDQIKVEFFGNRLRIAARDVVSRVAKHDESGYDSKEHSFQRMERWIKLPFPVTEDDTKATYTNGKLKIIIPKRNISRKTIDIENK